MSEQRMQNAIYTSGNITLFGKYEFLNLGSTTINDLIRAEVIKAPRMKNEHRNIKADKL